MVAEFNLTRKQSIAYVYLLDDFTTEIGYGGGAGGGKSYLGCYWVFSQCMHNPGVRYLIGRKELINLRKTTLATFFKMVGELGFVPSDLFRLNSMTNTITFKNGSEIVLMDMAYKPSDPEYLRFGGLELTGAFVDESNECEEKALSILKTRIGRAKNKEYSIKPKLLETFNPSKNHVYFRYYKPFKEKKQEDHKVFIPALVTDNSYLDDTYIDQLRKADKITRERLLNGNFDYDDDPSRLFDFDALNDLFTNKPLEVEQNVQENKYLTVDVARFGQDLSVLMLWKNFYVYKIHYFKKNDVKELVDYIVDLCGKEGIPRSHVVVDEDGVGCLPFGMEVMTSKGWKNSEDIVLEDVLLSKNKNGVKEFVGLNGLIYHDCEEFIKLDNGLSFTRGHSHFYKTRKEYDFKLDFWEEISGKKRIYFDDRIVNHVDEDCLVFDGTSYEMPNGGLKNVGNRVIVDSFWFAGFLGWYLSEGNVEGNKVCITQSVRSKYLDEICSIFDSLGFNWNRKKNGDSWCFYIVHKGLADWLKKNCYVKEFNCYNKKIPSILFDYYYSSVNFFLNCFVDGDGYYHKGQRQFVSSSKRLIDDLQFLLFLNGFRSNISVKSKKGSKSSIFGREIVRTTDVYLLSEVKEPVTCKVSVKRKFFDKAVNIKLNNSSKCLLVRFNNMVFWTHNGGVVDYLSGCKGFVNNSRPIENKNAKNNVANYANLKTQCYYACADAVNSGSVGVYSSFPEFARNRLIEDLEQVKRKNPDKDEKIRIVGKDEIKDVIGRSPDFGDAFMMRWVFELKPRFIAALA